MVELASRRGERRIVRQLVQVPRGVTRGGQWLFDVPEGSRVLGLRALPDPKAPAKPPPDYTVEVFLSASMRRNPTLVPLRITMVVLSEVEPSGTMTALLDLGGIATFWYVETSTRPAELSASALFDT